MLLGDIDFLGQRFSTADIAVILLLVVLEGLLSIDNALVLGLLAKRLPPHQRTRALSYGLIGAFVFRVIAISTASFLLRWTFVKFLGGAYLVYIAVRHLFFETRETQEDLVIVDAEGQPQLVDAETGKELSADAAAIEIAERVPIGSGLVTEASVRGEPSQGNESKAAKSATEPVPSKREILSPKGTVYAGFWRTVLVIELTDIAFAVDSILAAMALAGGRHDKLWLVITGGFLGVVLMRFAAAMFVRLLEQFPRFEVSAYLLVIVIGLKLLADWSFNSDWSLRDQPYAAKALGTATKSFENLEAARLRTIDSYEQWLEKRWVFGLAHHAQEPPSDGDVELPAAKRSLLDFHDIRRPECMTFWLTMLVCFLVGFMPSRKGGQSGSKS